MSSIVCISGSHKYGELRLKALWSILCAASRGLGVRDLYSVGEACRRLGRGMGVIVGSNDQSGTLCLSADAKVCRIDARMSGLRMLQSTYKWDWCTPLGLWC